MYIIIQAKFQNCVHRMFIVPATEIPLIFCLFFGITGTGCSAMFMSQIIRYGDFKLWTEYSNGSFLFWFNPTVTQGEIILSTCIQIITSSTRIWGKRLESRYPYFSDCWSKYFAFLRAKFFLKNAERIFFFLNKMNIQQKRNQTNIFYHGNICQECDY